MVHHKRNILLLVCVSRRSLFTSLAIFMQIVFKHFYKFVYPQTQLHFAVTQTFVINLIIVVPFTDQSVSIVELYLTLN